MTSTSPRLEIHAAPFVTKHDSTPALMVDVLLALVPVVGAAIYFFGVSALLVLLATTLGAALTEVAFGPARPRGSSLRDGSALLTGVLLGLTLPPGFPLWMAVIGGAVAIGLGKLLWGGLGQNLFNPALVGRAFLQAAFPTAITTWNPHGGVAELASLRGQTLAPPFLRGEVDAITTATPLARMKFEQLGTPLQDLLLGSTAGSLGETSAGILILCGLWLAFRRAFDWRIPVGIVLAVAAFAGILHLVDGARYPTPWFMVTSGGLLLGAVFMATDPVTSPLAPKGAWVFAVMIGFLVVLIRVFGGLPEGVMYAILLMNAATPLLERWTQPRAFGRGRGGRPGEAT